MHGRILIARRAEVEFGPEGLTPQTRALLLAEQLQLKLEDGFRDLTIHA